MRYNYNFYDVIRHTTTYKKQVLRRNKLLKKLYIYLACKYVNKNMVDIVKFSINNNISTSVNYAINNNKIVLHKIKLNVNTIQLQKLANKNCELSEYYNTRNRFFADFKYIKAFYRVAILHELYHVKQRLRGIIDNHNNIEELQADRWAIDRTKQELKMG